MYIYVERQGERMDYQSAIRKNEICRKMDGTGVHHVK
jgi:hypothetical protein